MIRKGQGRQISDARSYGLHASFYCLPHLTIPENGPRQDAGKCLRAETLPRPVHSLTLISDMTSLS